MLPDETTKGGDSQRHWGRFRSAGDAPVIRSAIQSALQFDHGYATLRFGKPPVFEPTPVNPRTFEWLARHGIFTDVGSVAETRVRSSLTRV